MHAEHSILQILAHVLIAAFFLFIGARNVPVAARHVERFRRLGIPFPGAFLAAGFATQFTGGVLVLADLYAWIGAILLLVFTVLANVLYHRYWTMTDVAQRQVHQNYFFNNLAVMGGLLLVLQG